MWMTEEELLDRPQVHVEGNQDTRKMSQQRTRSKRRPLDDRKSEVNAFSFLFTDNKVSSASSPSSELLLCGSLEKKAYDA